MTKPCPAANDGAPGDVLAHGTQGSALTLDVPEDASGNTAPVDASGNLRTDGSGNYLVNEAIASLQTDMAAVSALLAEFGITSS